MDAVGREVTAVSEAINRAANELVLIVIQFISPGTQGGAAAFATALGQRFTREPSETEDHS